MEKKKQIRLLADEIRSAEDDSKRDKFKRSKYISNQLNTMSDEQLTRFEFFVRSHFPRAYMKEQISQLVRERAPSLQVPDDVSISITGLTKMFVGEIMDIAVQVKQERTALGYPSSSVAVEHLEEAYRRMQNEGKIGASRENILNSFRVPNSSDELPGLEPLDLPSFSEENLTLQSELLLGGLENQNELPHLSIKSEDHPK